MRVAKSVASGGGVVVVATLLVLALGPLGCTTTARLRGQSAEVGELTQSIEQRAYQCAPRELALAKANREFGDYELSQGNFVRAKKHLIESERNARAADLLSDFDECRDQKVAMVVDTTPKTKIVEAKPTPTDRDGDGILDVDDKCPDEPEDFDGFEDEDGCPDPDNDGDGIADLLDQCPNEPETYNGFEDEDGCPDTKPIAQMDGDQIKLNEQVFFKFNKSDILPVSFSLLDEVARIMSENPTIHIRIEGHTDSKGRAAYNKTLSDQRATSVRKYLLSRGIDAERMQSVGYGAERPIEDNSTEAGRAANRRVEIHITKR